MQQEAEGDDDAWSLLHVVAWDGDLDKARSLLEVGHPVDPVLRTGHTPLHVAAQGGNTELARLLLDEGKAAVDAKILKSNPCSDFMRQISWALNFPELGSGAYLGGHHAAVSGLAKAAARRGRAACRPRRGG